MRSDQGEHGHRRRRDGRGERVAEQVGAGTLAQQFHHRGARAGEPARRAAERLAERARQDVDPVGDAEQFRRPRSGGAHEADSMRVVDHHERVVLVGDCADLVERGDVAVHREHAVGGDQLVPRARGRLKLAAQVVEVAVVVAVALRLRQAHSVDDGGVVQLVGDDRVLCAEQRLEQAAVGVEARRVQDGVEAFGAEPQERRERRLEFLVLGLRAADEPHRRHPEAPPVEGVLRRLDQHRGVGEAEVVVGAQVDHLTAERAHVGGLGGGQRRLLLVEPVGAKLGQFPVDLLDDVHACSCAVSGGWLLVSPSS